MRLEVVWWVTVVSVAVVAVLIAASTVIRTERCLVLTEYTDVDEAERLIATGWRIDGRYQQPSVICLSRPLIRLG